MSIIIRSAGVKRGGEKNQIYTWAACIMVLVFAVSIGVAVKSADKQSPSEAAYRKQAFDLGNMPFDDDSAEAYLLASNKYNDIAKNDLINGLFSPTQKQERQAEDALNGVPLPPDDDYKAAQEEKAAKKIRADLADKRKKEARAKISGLATSKGTLNRGSMASVSGGGGGSRGTLSNVGAGSANVRPGSKMSQTQAALISQVKGGRAMGFQHAAMASAQAANSGNLEAAAGGSVDAFQKGNTDAGKEFLESDLEKDSSALNIDEEDLKDKLERAGTSEELEGLDAKLNDLKKRKEEEEKTCDSSMWNNLTNGKGECFWSDVIDKAIGAMIGNFIGGIFKA